MSRPLRRRLKAVFLGEAWRRRRDRTHGRMRGVTFDPDHPGGVERIKVTPPLLRSIIELYIDHSATAVVHDATSRSVLEESQTLIRSTVRPRLSTNRDPVMLEISGNGPIAVSESIEAAVSMDAAARQRLFAWLALLCCSTAAVLLLTRASLLEGWPAVYLPVAIPAAMLAASRVFIPKLDAAVRRVLSGLVGAMRSSRLVQAATLLLMGGSLYCLLVFSLAYVDHAVFERRLAALKGFATTHVDTDTDRFASFLRRYPERPETWALLANHKEELVRIRPEEMPSFLERVVGTGPGTSGADAKDPSVIIAELRSLCAGGRLLRRLPALPASGISPRYSDSDCFDWAADAIRPAYHRFKPDLPGWRSALAEVDESRKCIHIADTALRALEDRTKGRGGDHSDALREVTYSAKQCEGVPGATEYLHLLNKAINLAAVLCAERPGAAAADEYRQLVYELLAATRDRVRDGRLDYSGPRNVAVLAWVGKLIPNDKAPKHYRKFIKCFGTVEALISGSENAGMVRKEEFASDAFEDVWYRSSLRTESVGRESEITALLARLSGQRWGY